MIGLDKDNSPARNSSARLSTAAKEKLQKQKSKEKGEHFQMRRWEIPSWTQSPIQGVQSSTRGLSAVNNVESVSNKY